MTQNRFPQNYSTKDLGNTLRLLELNIGIISRSKRDLNKILIQIKVDVLQQETLDVGFLKSRYLLQPITQIMVPLCV